MALTMLIHIYFNSGGASIVVTKRDLFPTTILFYKCISTVVFKGFL